MGLDIFTWVVMTVLVVAIVLILYKLGALPGRVARERQHPNAEAINVCGWIGLITLGPAWIVAIIWAYTSPARAHAGAASTGVDRDLTKRMATLEAEVKRLRRAFEDETR
jgi:hypothetical protein